MGRRAARAAAGSECGARLAHDGQARIVQAHSQGIPDTRERAEAVERLSMPVPEAHDAAPRGACPPEGPDRWYAVWTRSRHEQAVRAQLDEKAIPAFLPTISRWSRWKDRKTRIDVPRFPGYVFARFDPAARLAVLKCSGVVSIVSFNGEPAPV